MVDRGGMRCDGGALTGGSLTRRGCTGLPWTADLSRGKSGGGLTFGAGLPEGCDNEGGGGLIVG